MDHRKKRNIAIGPDDHAPGRVLYERTENHFRTIAEVALDQGFKVLWGSLKVGQGELTYANEYTLTVAMPARGQLSENECLDGDQELKTRGRGWVPLLAIRIEKGKA